VAAPRRNRVDLDMIIHRSLKFVSTLILLTYFSLITPASSVKAQPRPSTQTASSTSQAAPDPVMTTVRAGESAPFTGTLFSVSAAAQMLANLELTQERCDIQTNTRVRLTEANMQLTIDTERARFTALEYRLNEITKVKNDQINFLLRQHRPRPWYESGEFWFGLGSVVGVIITVAAGYALGQAYN
jgi:hypothetical protein